MKVYLIDGVDTEEGEFALCILLNSVSLMS